ncbi:MAG: methionine adenosyltransferase domain-containing protein [Alphaproteobacteria bacterium]|nr:methionine adenosyltransferase domain-containing protein [Alphaproteobacteria bacterium]
MIKTAEFVSLGHPDKTADYITSYILDRFIECDALTRYAVEVMIKGNTVVLGGEICSKLQNAPFEQYVKQALREIGYNEKYADIWGDKAINIHKVQVINLIGCQSCEIAQGVDSDGWGDQGVFVGYACQGDGFINRELYLARKLNQALYDKARQSDNLGLDIKTQITLENGKIKTAIAAVPMLKDENLNDFVCEVLGEEPQQIIINGTGNYTYHSAVADCGMTGRKLACDFYSTACPIGGGSPWTKDASKADLTLNLYARKLALKNLKDNDEVWVYLSSCIGKSTLPSAVMKSRKGRDILEQNIKVDARPYMLIKSLGLDKPVFAKLCREGLIR